jgi:hypothetical protein
MGFVGDAGKEAAKIVLTTLMVIIILTIIGFVLYGAFTYYIGWEKLAEWVIKK